MLLPREGAAKTVRDVSAAGPEDEPRSAAGRRAHLDTATRARFVSSRSGDGTQSAVDRSQTIGAGGHAAEWDTPRSVASEAPVNSLVVGSRHALGQRHAHN